MGRNTICEKSKDGYTLEMVNRLHDRIKTFFRGKRVVMINIIHTILVLNYSKTSLLEKHHLTEPININLNLMITNKYI